MSDADESRPTFNTSGDYFSIRPQRRRVRSTGCLSTLIQAIRSENANAKATVGEERRKSHDTRAVGDATDRLKMSKRRSLADIVRMDEHKPSLMERWSSLRHSQRLVAAANKNGDSRTAALNEGVARQQSASPVLAAVDARRKATNGDAAVPPTPPMSPGSESGSCAGVSPRIIQHLEELANKSKSPHRRMLDSRERVDLHTQSYDSAASMSDASWALDVHDEEFSKLLQEFDEQRFMPHECKREPSIEIPLNRGANSARTTTNTHKQKQEQQQRTARRKKSLSVCLADLRPNNLLNARKLHQLRNKSREWIEQFVHNRKSKQHTFGSYILKDPVGQGSFATLYRAFDPIANQECAIKWFDRRNSNRPMFDEHGKFLGYPNDCKENGNKMRPTSPQQRLAEFTPHVAQKFVEGFEEDRQEMEMFKQECQIMSLVGKRPTPTVVAFRRGIDWGIGRRAILMEFVPGIQLFDFLMGFDNHRLSEWAARDILVQLILGVVHCHKHYVAHCDLKLENVLVQSKLCTYRMPDGEVRKCLQSVKIVDFGLASKFNLKTPLNKFGGSLSYAAPEVLSGRPSYGPELDTWSLSVIAYILVLGIHPYQGSTAREVFEDIVANRCPPFFDPVSDLFEKYVLEKLFLHPPPFHRYEAYRMFDHEWIQTEDVTKLLPSKRKVYMYARRNLNKYSHFRPNVVTEMPSVNEQATPREEIETKTKSSVESNVAAAVSRSSSRRSERAHRKGSSKRDKKEKKSKKSKKSNKKDKE